MSKAPAMPMFWDAYLADTTHLSIEEHGAYMLLLAAMWRRNGWIPDDDRDNARILGITPAKWRRTKDRLSAFLMFADGQISQKNLLKIWKITQEKIEKNRENGAKGGRPRSSKNNDLEKANGSVSQKPIKTIPDPEPNPTNKEDTPSGADKPAVESMEVLIFRFGKTVLGKSAGGVITRLRKACRYDDAEALKHLEQARQKESPIEWINAAIKNIEAPKKYDVRNQPEYRGMLDPRMTPEELAYAKAHGLS